VVVHGGANLVGMSMRCHDTLLSNSFKKKNLKLLAQNNITQKYAFSYS
jgi:hypothetical protein